MSNKETSLLEQAVQLGTFDASRPYTPSLRVTRELLRHHGAQWKPYIDEALVTIRAAELLYLGRDEKQIVMDLRGLLTALSCVCSQLSDAQIEVSR
jgi:hypothetical protein